MASADRGSNLPAEGRQENLIAEHLPVLWGYHDIQSTAIVWNRNRHEVTGEVKCRGLTLDPHRSRPL